MSGLLLMCIQWSARAEGDVVLVRMLKEGQSASVRAGAASLLGRRRDVECRPELEGALHDQQPLVRAAAASGLGRLGSRASLDPLNQVAAHDRVPLVAREARAAMETIENQPGSATESDDRRDARDAKTAKPRYGLVLGEMRDQSGYAAPELSELLGRAVERNVAGLPSAALLGSLTAGGVASAAPGGLTVFRLDAALTSLSTTTRDGQLTVHCEVALLVMDQPTGALRTLLKGAARGVEVMTGVPSAADAAAPAAELPLSVASRVIDAAVRSALRNADSTIADAARPSVVPQR
jgi:hypothetical protein